MPSNKDSFCARFLANQNLSVCVASGAFPDSQRFQFQLSLFDLSILFSWMPVDSDFGAHLSYLPRMSFLPPKAMLYFNSWPISMDEKHTNPLMLSTGVVSSGENGWRPVEHIGAILRTQNYSLLVLSQDCFSGGVHLQSFVPWRPDFLLPDLTFPLIALSVPFKWLQYAFLPFN